ncbi:MAG: type II toxin-antitoxin system VapB family antitoxin [Nitrososphaerales archaeon]
MSVITARVDREIKKKMEELGQINWSKEIREFVRARIKQEERRRRVTQMSKRLSRLPKTETGFSAKSVQEDRAGR